MGSVNEQRGEDRQDPGAELEPARGGEAAHRQPPPGPRQLDDEQLRQFQQFQQFQDYLRYTEAQQRPGQLTTHQGGPPIPPPPHQQPTPAPPPRRRAPRVLVWLGKKVLGWLVFFLLLALAATWAYNHFFGNGEDEDLPAAMTGGGTYKTNEILSDKPYEAVRQVYDAIAQEDPATGLPLIPQACGRFAERTQQEFAADLGYADCRQAVVALHEQVTHVNAYAESIPSSLSRPVTGETLRVSSCEFGIDGGPALGAFTLTKVERGQWLITGHEAEPTPCPAPSGTSPTPTR
jgi:hypothetical protein